MQVQFTAYETPVWFSLPESMLNQYTDARDKLIIMPLSKQDFSHAEFLQSASRLQECPPDTGREIAFAGRSNAGKSSAINVLTQQRKLARISKTPGRTQLINFFGIAPDARLVDLPGYGYAKVPLSVKAYWQQHLDAYLRERQALCGLILLMDVRRPLQEFDRAMLDWAQQSGLAVHILLTKADKLKYGPAKSSLLQVQQAIAAQPHISVQLFSALKKTGIEHAQKKMLDWLNEEPVES